MSFLCLAFGCLKRFGCSPFLVGPHLFVIVFVSCLVSDGKWQVCYVFCLAENNRRSLRSLKLRTGLFQTDIILILECFFCFFCSFLVVFVDFAGFHGFSWRLVALLVFVAFDGSSVFFL